MTFSFRRLEGYRKRLVYEWSQWQDRRDRSRRQVAFQRWLSQLQSSPPQVLLGANFAEYGGVRGHIQAIQRYSKLDVQMAPPENLLHQIGTHSFTNDFRADFLNFPAKGIKVAHSHVFPWFIEWCLQHQKNGLRWIHTYHLNYYPEHGKSGEVEPWQQQINEAMLNQARFADVCLSVSKWQVKELRDRHGIESRYLPNGVDVAFCDQGRADRFRKKHRLDRFVLYVGRNDPVKNPQEFVELARRLPDVVFVMIGGGLSSETLATTQDLMLPANLKIIGGVSPLEVQDALSACSLLVVTSKREGLPTLVLEAMAHGRQLVVPDESGCMEAVGNGQYGQIYRRGDLADLVKRVSTTLETGDRNIDARQRVLAEYDWVVVAPQLDQFYSTPK
ncbi:MAG: glycosyltransferase family 4 protein [Planctomycetaceae bacterium]